MAQAEASAGAEERATDATRMQRRSISPCAAGIALRKAVPVCGLSTTGEARRGNAGGGGSQQPAAAANAGSERPALGGVSPAQPGAAAAPAESG